MIDTHAHLYMEQYAGEERATMERAIDAGVGEIWFANVDASTIAPMIALHEEFPDNSLISIGLHPTEVNDDWESVLDQMESEIHAGQYAAIGEIGLDLYHDTSKFALQRAAFLRQLEWALKYELPVLIHCREARDEMLNALKEFMTSHEGRLPRIVLHSFTGTPDDVTEIRKVFDPLFGINGVVTFKNARSLRDALPAIGIDRIVLETDAPYLAPTPHRGQRNESAYIPLIRNAVAATLNLSPEEVERITDTNARKFITG